MSHVVALLEISARATAARRRARATRKAVLFRLVSQVVSIAAGVDTDEANAFRGVLVELAAIALASRLRLATSCSNLCLSAVCVANSSLMRTRAASIFCMVSRS
jgi:hypothetical protein